MLRQCSSRLLSSLWLCVHSLLLRRFQSFRGPLISLNDSMITILSDIGKSLRKKDIHLCHIVYSICYDVMFYHRMFQTNCITGLPSCPAGLSALMILVSPIPFPVCQSATSTFAILSHFLGLSYSVVETVHQLISSQAGTRWFIPFRISTLSKS